MTASLPVTTKMRPRPVWDRYLRRCLDETLEAPTEEEKHDAICVLHEQFHWDLTPGPVTDLVMEAERIVIEAGL